ncbi:MAG: hypothetical protein WCA12_11620 [Burkholderiales bacterium]
MRLLLALVAALVLAGCTGVPPRLPDCEGPATHLNPTWAKQHGRS